MKKRKHFELLHIHDADIEDGHVGVVVSMSLQNYLILLRKTDAEKTIVSDFINPLVMAKIEAEKFYFAEAKIDGKIQQGLYNCVDNTFKLLPPKNKSIFKNATELKGFRILERKE